MTKGLMIALIALSLNQNTTVHARNINHIERRLEAEEQLANLDISNLEQWYIGYKSIVEEYYNDVPHSETMYDVFTEEEIDLFERIVEAEIGIGTFEQKVDIACVILNRLNSDGFPNDMISVLTQKTQFTTYLNGSYEQVAVQDSTRLACEYACIFHRDEVNDCMWFRSGDDKTWHDKNKKLERVCFDGEHYFYRLKEEN